MSKYQELISRRKELADIVGLLRLRITTAQSPLSKDPADQPRGYSVGSYNNLYYLRDDVVNKAFNAAYALALEVYTKELAKVQEKLDAIETLLKENP